MKYYALAWDGGAYNLNIRPVYYDRDAHAQFRQTLGAAKRCAEMDYGELDYLGGKKPRFEDMRFNLMGGYIVSEKFRDIVIPFLSSPDDVEWLYTPQREDPEMPFPCHDRYYHFNVLKTVAPEDCFSMSYWTHEPTGKVFIKTLTFHPEAAQGLHVFKVDYRLNNFFISEVVLKALKKAKLFKIITKDMPTQLESLRSLYNSEVSRSKKP